MNNEEYIATVKAFARKTGHSVVLPTIGFKAVYDCKYCSRRFRIWVNEFGSIKYWSNGSVFDSIDFVPSCEKLASML